MTEIKTIAYDTAKELCDCAYAQKYNSVIIEWK